MNADSRTCGDCRRIHETTWVRAVGRFEPMGPTGYRADYSGSPARVSRQAAELDMCRMEAAK